MIFVFSITFFFVDIKIYFIVPMSPKTTSKFTMNATMVTPSKNDISSSKKSDFKKLQAFCIDWLDYKQIKIESTKYTRNPEKHTTIEEDIYFLLSQFKTIDIRYALSGIIFRVNNVYEHKCDDINQIKKERLVEYFSQLLFDYMSIMTYTKKLNEM